MLFTQIEFFALLFPTVFLYYLPPIRRAQIGVLVAASFIFYAYHLPALLILLITSILFNGGTAWFISRRPARALARTAAVLGVVFNLLVLGFFKYNKLLAGLVFADISKLDGIGAVIVALPLPIGISFYTFQGISLVIDQFRRKTNDAGDGVLEGKSSYVGYSVRTGLFLSFFPQLIAGPIVKASEFLPQIKAKYFRDIEWNDVTRYLILGFFLKLVIADNLKDNTIWIKYPALLQESSWDLLSMLLAYSVQIFADFAGYSYIALGLGAIFQYRLPVNFNYPYISRSFSEFWTRWHISLSSFLRDYLYIPLGGNRVAPWRMYLNLMITMILGGLWHGAAWSYAFWGFFHGLLLVMERPFLQRGWYEKFPDTARRIFVFACVTFGWLFFVLNDISHAVEFLKAIGTSFHRPARLDNIWLIILYSLPVFCMHFYYLHGEKLRARFPGRHWKPVAFAIMLFLISSDAGESDAFIYFQF